MKMWASRQMRQELMTGRAGLIIGGTLTFLVFLVLILVNQMQGEMRVHPVSTADEAAEAQEAGWIAETAYSRKELLGSVTLETASQGEISFMMGGVVGAAPGRKVTTEEEYRIWALGGNSSSPSQIRICIL